MIKDSVIKALQMQSEDEEATLIIAEKKDAKCTLAIGGNVLDSMMLVEHMVGRIADNSDQDFAEVIAKVMILHKNSITVCKED